MIIDPSADDRLDRAFMALGDPVRRRIIARLSRGPATVNELAEPFQITKQAVSKHIQVLEQAGLVTRTRDAQRRPVHLDAAQLEALTAWIDRYRLIHEQQFRTLDSLLATDRGTNAAPSVADSTADTDGIDDTFDADASAGTSRKETGQ
ncbi:MAG TPA: metalloregulator ArsR/SmtB family transcription factor [Agromyces sp.]|nr:metalloregulator ArsR/SmtB family transcription factor [Agromyces sp.]